MHFKFVFYQTAKDDDDSNDDNGDNDDVGDGYGYDSGHVVGVGGGKSADDDDDGNGLKPFYQTWLEKMQPKPKWIKKTINVMNFEKKNVKNNFSCQFSRRSPDVLGIFCEHFVTIHTRISFKAS